MANAVKLLKKMSDNPRDWRIEQVETVAVYYGFSVNRPGSGSSHVVLRHDSGAMLTVPARRPIKEVYIKKFVRLVEDLCQ